MKILSKITMTLGILLLFAVQAIPSGMAAQTNKEPTEKSFQEEKAQVKARMQLRSKCHEKFIHELKPALTDLIKQKRTLKKSKGELIEKELKDSKTYNTLKAELKALLKKGKSITKQERKDLSAKRKKLWEEVEKITSIVEKTQAYEKNKQELNNVEAMIRTKRKNIYQKDADCAKLFESE